MNILSNTLKNSHNQSGVTFLELLLVVSLVALLSLLSTSFYARFLTQNSVQSTTDYLVNTLRKAQTYSISGRQGGIWGVRYSSDTITLYLQGNPAFDETYAVGSAIAINGFSDVTFAKVTGAPTPSPLTITIQSGPTSKSIIVTDQGVVNRVD